MTPQKSPARYARYRTNRDFGDSYFTLVKSILGQSAFDIASDYRDQKQATDMVVSMRLPRRGQIAVRNRRYEECKPWPWEITVRSWNKGIPTEIDKFRQGWGDWMLYVVPKPKSESESYRYYLLDIDKWREMDNLAPDAGKETANVGGNTRFRAYDVRRMPPGVVIDWKNEVDGSPWQHGRPLPSPEFGDKPYAEVGSVTWIMQ